MMTVAVIGAGRVGLTLARALRRSRGVVNVLTRSTRALPAELAADTDWTGALSGADLVILAVPDDAIAPLATELASGYPFRAGQIVLHTSGLHSSAILGPLASMGVSCGSFHPLQSFPDRVGNPERLHGSPAVIEGDERALEAARLLASDLGLSPVIELSAAGKVKYHAAAVFASNYVVVLAGIAQQLMGEAGISEQEARALFAPIMRETVAHLASRSPGSVLTGPVARGDRGTVEAHLDALDGKVRALYEMLAGEAGRLSKGRAAN
jgi:predicted short-subunit dehydrogenase-like oxidoreductase (DUF2520 family)